MVFLVSLSSSTLFNDVKGGVVEGYQGKSLGQAVLYKLLSGGGTGPGKKACLVICGLGISVLASKRGCGGTEAGNGDGTEEWKR